MLEYYQTNYVFFVDSSTEGYINSKYVDEAVECLTENRVRDFLLILGQLHYLMRCLRLQKIQEVENYLLHPKRCGKNYYPIKENN